ncbi:unnamed protein product, partial [Callosobruchus maculatus]
IPEFLGGFAYISLDL